MLLEARDYFSTTRSDTDAYSLSVGFAESKGVAA